MASLTCGYCGVTGRGVTVACANGHVTCGGNPGQTEQRVTGADEAGGGCQVALLPRPLPRSPR
eukprot:1130964-Rhodomonas_salina.1